jgi:hypothetical protein
VSAFADDQRKSADAETVRRHRRIRHKRLAEPLPAVFHGDRQPSDPHGGITG